MFEELMDEAVLECMEGTEMCFRRSGVKVCPFYDFTHLSLFYMK